MHALLGALTDAGYLARHPRLRTYTLGPAVVALGTAALETHPAIDLARDAARGLARETGLEVAVTSVAGDHIIFLARAGDPSPTRRPRARRPARSVRAAARLGVRRVGRRPVVARPG